MDKKFPITKERVRNAWTYSKWVLVLLVALSLGGCSLFYQMTAYRVPDEKKVEFYIDAYGADTYEPLDALMETIRLEALPEDVEEVSYRFMGLDDTYGVTQLTTWVSAGEGDVFLFTEGYFRFMAEGGALLPLQPLIDQGVLDVSDIDLAAGYAIDADTRERNLYGIPADALLGLESCGVPVQGCYLCLLVQDGVELEHSTAFMRYLLTDLREPIAPPVEAPAQ